MTELASPAAAELVGLTWQDVGDGPLIRPPRGSPIVADPTFLPPAETPDGRWHLFAHTLRGMQHWVSDDGRGWTHHGLAVRLAMRPFLYREGETYYLLYERRRPLALHLAWLPLRWRSWIELRSSRDLTIWSRPVALLRPSLPWHADARLGAAVGNPCLVRRSDGYALYHSAGLVRIPDCGFNEPRAIGLARAARLAGPYEPLPDPLISPRADDPRCNLSAGCLKVLACRDGFAGLQNGIYRDAGSGRSGSAISLLTSPDGVAWRYAHDHPIVAPGGTGWRRAFVYACDLRRDARDGRWWLFFNARDDWWWTRGREAIGALVGEPGATP